LGPQSQKETRPGRTGEKGKLWRATKPFQKNGKPRKVSESANGGGQKKNGGSTPKRVLNTIARQQQTACCRQKLPVEKIKVGGVLQANEVTTYQKHPDQNKGKKTGESKGKNEIYGGETKTKSHKIKREISSSQSKKKKKKRRKGKYQKRQEANAKTILRRQCSEGGTEKKFLQWCRELCETKKKGGTWKGKGHTPRVSLRMDF